LYGRVVHIIGTQADEDQSGSARIKAKAEAQATMVKAEAMTQLR
jgi:hypothetical protein